MTAADSRPVLSGAGLLLRAPTLADATGIADAIQDPEIPRWIGVIPVPYTLADAEYFVRDLSDPGWDSGASRQWLITHATTGDLLGVVGLHERLAGVSEVGFWVRQQVRGRGIATAAVRLVCQFGFDTLGLERVEWQALVGNDASRRVAERAGFQLEGVLRGRLVHRGRAEDAWVAARLATDADTADTADRADSGPQPIDSGRLRLRGWRPEDAADLLDVADDPLLRRYSSVGEIQSHDDAVAWMSSRRAPGRVDWAVRDAHSDALLGRVGLMGLDADEYAAEIGYWTAPAARGRGVASEAVRIAATHGFDSLGRHRLEIRHVPGNDASCAVASRAGFRVEGIQRAAHHHAVHGFEDLEVHARLATDP